MAIIDAIYRYPVKGLSPEPLASTDLEAGGVVPFDRAFAIENGPSGFDPAEPRPLPKIAFLMLMRNERLATLSTRFDPATRHLTIMRNGGILAEGDLDTADGRSAIERFFAGFAAGELRGPPRIVSAPGHSFSDSRSKLVSVINLASVRDLEAHVGVPLDPLRFRGNLHVEGLEPWAEFDWVGRRITAGSLVFEGVKRIERCAATNVDPQTGARDLAIPRTLLDVYGHADCGVYLRVLEGGGIARGDVIDTAA